MAKVTGLGGIFFKTSDKTRLLAFYRDVLGMDVQDWGAMFVPDRDASPRYYSVWSPMAQDSKYFDPSKREFMVNLRVDDLDGVLERVRAAGATVLDRRENTEQGLFGYVVDPDGTLLELFQPSNDDPSLS